MELEKRKHRGRLVPILAAGIEYPVNYEIYFPILDQKPARILTPNHTCATKCRMQSAHHHLIPDGRYFLQAGVDQIHQLKSIDRKWHYLATR